MSITIQCEKCGAVNTVSDDKTGQIGKCHCGTALMLPGGTSTGERGLPKPTGATLNLALAVLVLLEGLMLAGVAGYRFIEFARSSPLASPTAARAVISFGVAVLLMVSAVGLLRLHIGAWWAITALLSVSVLSHSSGLLGGPAPLALSILPFVILQPLGNLAAQVVLLLYYLWARKSFVQAGVGSVKLAPTLLVCLPLIVGIVLLFLCTMQNYGREEWRTMLVSALQRGDLKGLVGSGVWFVSLLGFGAGVRTWSQWARRQGWMESPAGVRFRKGKEAIGYGMFVVLFALAVVAAGHITLHLDDWEEARLGRMVQTLSATKDIAVPMRMTFGGWQFPQASHDSRWGGDYGPLGSALVGAFSRASSNDLSRAVIRLIKSVDHPNLVVRGKVSYVLQNVLLNLQYGMLGDSVPVRNPFLPAEQQAKARQISPIVAGRILDGLSDADLQRLCNLLNDRYRYGFANQRTNAVGCLAILSCARDTTRLRRLAVPPLLRALKGSFATERDSFLAGLLNLRDERVVPLMTAELQSRNRDAPSCAGPAWALARIGPPAVPALRGLLEAETLCGCSGGHQTCQTCAAKKNLVVRVLLHIDTPAAQAAVRAYRERQNERKGD